MLGPITYSLIIGPATTLCFGLAWLAARRRPARGALSLTGLCIGAGIWGIATLVQLLVDEYALSLVWGRLAYVGIGLAVLSWAVLAIAYTGRERYLTPTVIGLLCIEPILINVLVWTNPMELVWTGIEPGSIYGFRVSYGPAFWAHAAYSYLLQIGATLLLLGHVYRLDGPYRGQALALVLGLSGPWAANLLWLGGATAVDWTPMGFAVGGVAVFWAMQTRDFVDLTPVASRTVLERIPSGVAVVDAEGRFLEVNPEFRRLVGPEPDELIGQHVADALAEWPMLLDAIDSSAATDDARTIEVSADGRDYQVEIDPLWSDPTRPVDLLILVHDITDRTRRERELERQNEQLDRFAKVVSHDIRNPLNVASGFVDVTQETGDLDNLERVQNAHERMDQLLANVQTLIKDGQTVTETETLRLETVARDAAANVDLSDATVEIEEIGVVQADRNRLLHVFENLFRNAAEHGPGDDHDELTIRVGRLDDDNGLYVADDGIGIPADRRGEVFKHGHTTNDGTGLGLAIVENSITAHGWEIGLAEATDGGARFEITGVKFQTDPSAPDAAAEPVAFDD